MERGAGDAFRRGQASDRAVRPDAGTRPGAAGGQGASGGQGPARTGRNAVGTRIAVPDVPAVAPRDAGGSRPDGQGAVRTAAGARPQRGGADSVRDARSSRQSGSSSREARGATAAAQAGGRSGASRRSRSGAAASSSRSGGKAAIVIAVIAVVVVALIAGYVVLSQSSLLRIDRIEALGVEHLTADEVELLADIPEDATLLSVDEAAIREKLMQDAWVEDVEVMRIPPGTLRLNVTEREVFAVVSIPSSNATVTRRWLISTDEIWLMPVPETTSEAAKTTSSKVFEDADTALKITDVPYGEQPEIGKKNTNEYVQLAIDVVKGLTTSLKDRVVSVQAKDTLSVTLVLDNNVQIVFGDTEDIREKERICLELLERYPDELSYINVRSVENPTWRSI